MATEAVKTSRKAPARHRDVVLAALEERLRCIVRDDQNEVHLIRCDELFDELRRSLRKDSGKAEAAK